ncbi:MAG: hypothetical protein EXR72_12055 [Myxococcales bacterium]|nr:hypothetical protein [Myxococcales bacterium]
MTPKEFALFVAASLLSLLATARAERHPVFSLVDNRPLAHTQRRGGLYIAAGGAGMARYVHFSRPLPTWRLRAVEEGRKVGLAMAAATLEVPLTPPQAAANAVHIGLKAPAQSSLRISASGKPSAAIALSGAWQVITVPLPDGALHAGENRLALTFAKWGKYGGQKAAAAVEFIQIGGSAPAAADPPSPPAGIRLGKGAGAAFYAYVPKGGAVAATGEAGRCRVTVRAEGLAESELKLDGTPVDLGALGGKFTRLELFADGPQCEAATLARADLLADGPAPVRAAPKPPKNVIIWLTDNTRADKFRLYNPKSRVETPVFDALAKESTLFKVAYTQGNESRVSHASLWTSAYPSVHKMIPEKAKLPQEFVTLAEAVRPSGRHTVGVMGNGFIDVFWGFGEGWDYLKNHIHQGGGLKGDDLIADALKQLDAPPIKGGKPFFLYIGSIDAHVSWRAHEPWLAKYDPAPYTGDFVKACTDPQLDQIVAGKLAVNERDKVRIIALYDADISYNDHVLGKLLAALKKRGQGEDTMLIMTSDHGEEFWDHGRIGHGQSLRQELVHVPFLIHYPPYFPPGRVVEEGVEVLDVLPTITDALGVATPEAVQGESLIPLAQGFGAGYPRPSIASQYELAHAMRLGSYKIWVGGSGDVRLFDGAADPHEDHDLMATRPIERRALTDALGLWMANRNQWKKRRWGVASNLAPGFASEMEK